MRVNCPSCGHTHDLSIKQVLGYITTNQKAQKAVRSLMASLNGKKGAKGGKNMSRGTEGARKAANAGWLRRTRVYQPGVQYEEGQRVRFKKEARGLPVGLYQMQGGEFASIPDEFKEGKNKKGKTKA